MVSPRLYNCWRLEYSMLHQNQSSNQNHHGSSPYQFYRSSGAQCPRNLSLQKMPKEIIQDFENFLTSTQTPRMKLNSQIPSFTLNLRNHQHTFHGQQFAPPPLRPDLPELLSLHAYRGQWNPIYDLVVYAAFPGIYVQHCVMIDFII